MPARLRSTGSRISLGEIADRHGIAEAAFACHERLHRLTVAEFRPSIAPITVPMPAPTQAPAWSRPYRTPAERLLAWYDRHHRELPWRIPPAALRAGRRPDPYRVWLSEIMLQQTTVEAVKPYFRAFVARWPDVAALGCRRYRGRHEGVGRARLLFARPQPEDCAGMVAGELGGRFPDTAKRRCGRCPASAPTPPRRSPRSPSTGRPPWSTAMSSA